MSRQLNFYRMWCFTHCCEEFFSSDQPRCSMTFSYFYFCKSPNQTKEYINHVLRRLTHAKVNAEEKLNDDSVCCSSVLNFSSLVWLEIKWIEADVVILTGCPQWTTSNRILTTYLCSAYCVTHDVMFSLQWLYVAQWESAVSFYHFKSAHKLRQSPPGAPVLSSATSVHCTSVWWWLFKGGVRTFNVMFLTLRYSHVSELIKLQCVSSFLCSYENTRFHPTCCTFTELKWCFRSWWTCVVELSWGFSTVALIQSLVN